MGGDRRGGAHTSKAASWALNDAQALWVGHLAGVAKLYLERMIFTDVSGCKGCVDPQNPLVA